MATIAVTPDPVVDGASATIAVTGATATTDYVISLTSDTGTRRQDIKVTTSGAGAVTVLVPITNHLGDTITASLRPATEWNGTTTATATDTFTKKIA